MDGKVALRAGGTVIDHGTLNHVAGHYTATQAVNFGTVGNSLLELYPGAVVIGGATAGGTGNRLELPSAASAGTVSGLGTSFTGFGTITVDAGAQWTIAGGNSLAGGVTLSDHGTLTNSGTMVNAGALLLAGSSANRAVLVDSGTLVGSVGFAAGSSNYATLKITDAANLPGAIAGFTGAHDVVDLTQLSDAGNDAFAVLDPVTDILTVTGDNGSVQLQLDAENYSGIGWVVTSDGLGGSNVVAASGPPNVTVALAQDTGASSSDRITSNPALAGGGAANATVIISEGIATLGTATANGSGVWAFTPTGLTDGVQTLNVRETTSGGTGTASLTITLDTSAPTLAITSAGGLTGQATQTIAGTVSDANLAANPTISLFDNGNPLGTTTASGGSWSTSVTLSGDGPHSITARASDLAGNTGTSSADALTLDTTAPAVVISSGGGLTNQATQTIAGTVSDADNLPASPTINLFDNGNPAGTTTASGGAWSTALTLSGDGAHNITARASDLAGNTGTSGSDALTLDTTAPAVAISSSGGLTNQAAQTITGTVSDADNLPANPTISLFDNGTPVGTTTASGGAWSTALTLSGDGAHNITARATDLAGNTGTSSADALTLDTTAPAVVISSGGGLTNQAAQTIAGTVSDADNLPASPTINLFDNGNPAGTTTASGGAWSTALTLSGDGAHNITARATDLAGNTGTSSADALTLDTTSPAVAIGSSGGLTNQATQTITGTVSDANLAANPTISLFDNGTPVGTTTASGGAWSTSVTLSGDGAHNITAQASDLAGNTGTSGADALTLDTTAPAVAISTGGGLTNQPTQTIAGTVSDANLAANPTISLFDNGTPVGTTTASGGAWSTALTLSGDGAHSITAQASDLAGNTGTSGADALTLDTAAPVAVKDRPLLLPRGGTAKFPASLLQFADNLSGSAQETYTVITAPQTGTLLLNGTPASTFTQDTTGG